MVAVLLYVQWTKAQHRAKMSKWMLKLKKKGYAATIVAVKEKNISSANCDSSRSHETVVDIEKDNIQMGKYELRPWSHRYYMFSGLKHNIGENYRNGC